jgi:hypothetical protein
MTFCLAAIAIPASAGIVTQWPAGTVRYKLVEREINGGQEKTIIYTLDLVTGRDGGVTALIQSAADKDGKPLEIAADCRTRMNAPVGGLATIRLWPAAKDLGPTFLDLCAPADLFHAMTDMSNIVVIRTAPQFGGGGLAKSGDKHSFDGFKAQWMRGGEEGAVATPGGIIALTALDETKAVVQWQPAPMAVNLTISNPNGTMKISATEDFAFELSIEEPSGVLIEARTLHDDLNGTILLPNVPADHAPKLVSHREVLLHRLQ